MTSNSGCLGTIGLMTNISYVTSIGDDREELFKSKCFLRDHLYYLINPVDYTKSKFIAFTGFDDH